MSEIGNGGPAFPAQEVNLSYASYSASQGMSLRDWFAGQAIRARWGSGAPMTPEDAASMAYQIADAMLEARQGFSAE
jgi:hypothetical protein